MEQLYTTLDKKIIELQDIGKWDIRIVVSHTWWRGKFAFLTVEKKEELCKDDHALTPQVAFRVKSWKTRIPTTPITQVTFIGKDKILIEDKQYWNF